MVSLVIITFISNLILIPIFEELPGRSGIEGAAIATSISLFILNFVSFLFLWSKYKLQPYNYKLILLTLIGILIIFINSFLPEFQNIFIDIILRSMLVIIIFTPLVYFLKISEDFNRLLNKCLAIINIKL
jgi:Na+-driven multidrug efflux pump